MWRSKGNVMLDRESIDAMSDEEKGELLVWLVALVKYVRAKLGMDEEPEVTKETLTTLERTTIDPVGDSIILEHKMQQLKASQGRRKSGWMDGATGTAGAKVDDRHV
jgi:hypothetical protein